MDRSGEGDIEGHRAGGEKSPGKKVALRSIIGLLPFSWNALAYLKKMARSRERLGH